MHIHTCIVSNTIVSKIIRGFLFIIRVYMYYTVLDTFVSRGKRNKKKKTLNPAKPKGNQITKKEKYRERPKKNSYGC